MYLFSLFTKKKPFHTLHLKVATHYKGSWNSWHQLQQSLLVFWGGTKFVSNGPTFQICLVPKWSFRSSKAALCERILLEGPYQKPARNNCETCNKGFCGKNGGPHLCWGMLLFFFHFLVLVVVIWWCFFVMFWWIQDSFGTQNPPGETRVTNPWDCILVATCSKIAKN